MTDGRPKTLSIVRLQPRARPVRAGRQRRARAAVRHRRARAAVARERGSVGRRRLGGAVCAVRPPALPAPATRRGSRSASAALTARAAARRHWAPAPRARQRHACDCRRRGRLQPAGGAALHRAGLAPGRRHQGAPHNRMPTPTRHAACVKKQRPVTVDASRRMEGPLVTRRHTKAPVLGERGDNRVNRSSITGATVHHCGARTREPANRASSAAARSALRGLRLPGTHAEAESDVDCSGACLAVAPPAAAVLWLTRRGLSGRRRAGRHARRQRVQLGRSRGRAALAHAQLPHQARFPRCTVLEMCRLSCIAPLSYLQRGSLDRLLIFREAIVLRRS